MISSISKSVIYTVDFRGVKLAGTKDDLLSLRSEIWDAVDGDGNSVENRILATVCEHFHITMETLCNGPRHSHLCDIRFMTYRLLMDKVRSSKRVGELIPHYGQPRDHGTILSGLARHNELVATSRTYAEEFRKLKKRVKQ